MSIACKNQDKPTYTTTAQTTITAALENVIAVLPSAGYSDTAPTASFMTQKRPTHALAGIDRHVAARKFRTHQRAP